VHTVARPPNTRHDYCCKIAWLLKNSHSRNSPKFHRAKMPYKRRSRFWWTFSIPSPGPFFSKQGFFNSHA